MDTLQVLLEDHPVLAVNKPVGLLTQGPPAAADTLVLRIRDYLRTRYAKRGNVYLGIPHRLDRAVSGVILFSKNSKGARRLAEQFRDRQIKKTYWAVTSELPIPEHGTLIDRLEKVTDRPLGRVTDSPLAREAVLQYRVLRGVTAGWLIEVRPVTGRFHQIRIQLAHHGWPILGDDLYGSAVGNGEAGISESDRGAASIALHARAITFLHPIRYEVVTVTAPLPDGWRRFGVDADEHP